MGPATFAPTIIGIGALTNIAIDIGLPNIDGPCTVTGRRSGGAWGGTRFRRGIFHNRTQLRLPGVCEATVEHRSYAHRTRMNIFVMEVVVSGLVIHSRGAAGACEITLRSFETVEFDNTPDFHFNVTTKAAGVHHPSNHSIKDR